MLFDEALEFTFRFRGYFQSKDTFLISSRPGSIYYSGVEIYADQNVRVSKLDNSNGQPVENITLKSLIHRIV